jgi:predicted amidophosphoribosyltransferase
MEEQPEPEDAPAACASCGAELAADSAFCQECGAKAGSAADRIGESDFLRPAEPSEQEPPETSATIPTPAPPMEEQPEPDDAPRFCSNCGSELEADSKFCQECGEKVQ